MVQTYDTHFVVVVSESLGRLFTFYTRTEKPGYSKRFTLNGATPFTKAGLYS